MHGFKNLKNLFSCKWLTYNCTQICIPLLFSSRGALIEGVPFSMIVALCLGDLDALSNYDPLLFLHCCSYVVEDCSHRTLYLPACNVLYAEIQFVLTIERGIVKPEFGPKFAFSSTSRLGSLVSDLRLPPYLNLLTKVMKGNWLCFTRRNL